MHKETENFLFNVFATLAAVAIGLIISNMIVDNIIGEFPNCVGNCTIKTIW